MRREGDPPGVPVADAPEDLGLEVPFCQEIGTLAGHRCLAASVPPEAQAPEGMAFRSLRGLFFGGVEEEFFAMAGRAKQIAEWHETHRFCGRDGARTVPGPEELARECPRCGTTFYPRLNPAVIVLVEHGDRLLLARSPHFPPGMYSTLAGFVEPGESIEETIEREICEEVGVAVGNVRYFGSQPWPFPHSLMIGFTAEYAGGEIRIEPEEIEDARWFTVDDLPPELPPKVSIARAMIDDFLARRGRGLRDLETQSRARGGEGAAGEGG
jgi:NAD+ diphosphatase